MRKPKIKLATASNRELATFYKVSVSTVKAWQRKGYPVREPEKLQAALDSQRSAKEIAPGTPLAAARLAKVLAETEKIRFENECAKGLWLLKSDVVDEGNRFGSWCRNELELLVNQTAPLWSGLSSADIQTAARKWLHGYLTRMQKATI